MCFSLILANNRNSSNISSYLFSSLTKFTFILFVADALLADLQNTVPGQNGSNGQQNGTNGTPGYGCLKGARRKEPQVVSI